METIQSRVVDLSSGFVGDCDRRNVLGLWRFLEIRIMRWVHLNFNLLYSWFWSVFYDLGLPGLAWSRADGGSLIYG